MTNESVLNALHEWMRANGYTEGQVGQFEHPRLCPKCFFEEPRDMRNQTLAYVADQLLCSHCQTQYLVQNPA